MLSETLTKVLNYKIDVRCKTGKSVIKGEAMASCHLDSSALGVNSILSEAYTTCVFYYDIMVHNIPWNQYKHFIKDGIHSNVLSFMLPYFFPMDADVNIVLLCEPNSAFTLSAVSQESFLGFNSLI